jgi:hypothetical protein
MTRGRSFLASVARAVPGASGRQQGLMTHAGAITLPGICKCTCTQMTAVVIGRSCQGRLRLRDRVCTTSHAPCAPRPTAPTPLEGTATSMPVSLIDGAKIGRLAP